MSWGDALEQVNYLNALWATLATVVLGYLWYGEKLFADNWRKLVGLKKKDTDKSEDMPVLMTLMVVAYYASAVFLGTVLVLTGMSGGGDSALTGLLLGVFAAGLPMLVNNTYARRKLELTLIDAGYVVVAFTAMGYILGAF